MNLVKTLSRLEADDNVHMGRLLVLLRAFAGKDGAESIEGLTKLAKLDFLLRYPVYLERALQARNASTRDVKVEDHEKASVESSMVRFRYGPWDFRYRRFLNLLAARGLVRVNTEGRTIDIGLTPEGVRMAEQIASDEAFSDIARRARILRTHFDIGGTFLMKFVYRTFPEIATLRYGEEIH